MIRHTVVFKLKYPEGSHEEAVFLEAAMKLMAITGAQQFELLRQTSPKNDYDYGLSMEFQSSAAYQAYTEHSYHVNFVTTYWGVYVDKFLEIDYEPMSQIGRKARS